MSFVAAYSFSSKLEQNFQKHEHFFLIKNPYNQKHCSM